MKKLKTPFDQHTWSNKKHFMLIQVFFPGIFNFPSPYFQKSPKPQLWKRIWHFVHKILKMVFWYFIAKLLHLEHDKMKCFIFLKSSLLMSWMKLFANTFDLPETPLFQWKYYVSKRIHWGLFAVLSTSKSLCFLCFYLGWWEPEPKSQCKLKCTQHPL